MKKIGYDDLLEKINNKYILTVVCGERAREIGNGAPVLTKCRKKDTNMRKVFKEIIDNKITYEMVNDSNNE